ncbi:DUF4240 domain-containing protein [Streptomyces europaeiscabiei]|uniref:DUF4240 domain-containing protein n=1 Tax=Streptomyces europaeiscabiei TaxID=146819 RepID=UPI0038F6AE75
MDENTFWQFIDECRPDGRDPDAEGLAEALVARLVGGSVSGVVGFAEQLAWVLYRLDRKELGDDLSSDGFLYTRAAVVVEGRDVYEAVLRDPSGFIPYATGLVWAEPLLYVPDLAYRQITGEEWGRETRYSYESYSNAEGWAEA